MSSCRPCTGAVRPGSGPNDFFEFARFRPVQWNIRAAAPAPNETLSWPEDLPDLRREVPNGGWGSQPLWGLAPWVKKLDDRLMAVAAPRGPGRQRGLPMTALAPWEDPRRYCRGAASHSLGNFRAEQLPIATCFFAVGIL